MGTEVKAVTSQLPTFLERIKIFFVLSRSRGAFVLSILKLKSDAKQHVRKSLVLCATHLAGGVLLKKVKKL